MKTNLTSEQFMDRYNEIKKPIVDHFGAYLYFLSSNVLNLNELEKMVEKQGFETERKQYQDNSMSFYTDIKRNGKIVGNISVQVFPSIEWYKGSQKYAKLFVDEPLCIKPLPGVHRVLDWHTKRGKFHVLAGGQTVLHFLPFELTVDTVTTFLNRIGITDYSTYIN